jgi:hypothetical protein
MRSPCAAILFLVACGAIFKPTRSQPPDTWALKAAVIHAMVTAPEYIKGDCSAAPMPDLELFCKKRCGDIGELTLKAYCSWECDDVKNPDVGVMCKLEVKRSKKDKLDAKACDAINSGAMRGLCQQWIASLPKK